MRNLERTLENALLIALLVIVCLYAAYLYSGGNNELRATFSYPLVTRGGYVTLAERDASAAGIDPTLFVRQINQESGFSPTAVSSAGAIGIAQFMPDTASGLGIDPWDPIQSLWGAAQLMARYDHNYGGNYAMALAAYNGGTGTLAYATRTCGIWWRSCLPAETQRYIADIMG